MLREPLQFEPGTKYAYSNFGYCLLGRVIEKVPASAYDEYVQHEVLAPLGIKDMHIGHTLLKDRRPNEVHYYSQAAWRRRSSVRTSASRSPWPYGGWYLEAMDSHGGWIASAADLVRFAVGVQRSRKM